MQTISNAEKALFLLWSGSHILITHPTRKQYAPAVFYISDPDGLRTCSPELGDICRADMDRAAVLAHFENMLADGFELVELYTPNA